MCVANLNKMIYMEDSHIEAGERKLNKLLKQQGRLAEYEGMKQAEWE